MEAILDEAKSAVQELNAALEKYAGLQDKIAELIEYYEGPDWRKDFEDDENGKLPADLKRGVLSEDAVYNFLADNQELLHRMKEFPGDWGEGI